MMNPTYIYVFEDGTLGWTDKPPTADDEAAVDDGVLSVVRIDSDGVREYYNSEWLDIAKMKG